jgi:hypothetical protein
LIKAANGIDTTTDQSGNFDILSQAEENNAEIDIVNKVAGDCSTINDDDFAS